MQVGSTYPTYERRTDGIRPHLETKSCSDILRGQYGISPGPSINKDGLRPVPSKNITQVGMIPD